MLALFQGPIEHEPGNEASLIFDNHQKIFSNLLFELVTARISLILSALYVEVVGSTTYFNQHPAHIKVLSLLTVTLQCIHNLLQYCQLLACYTAELPA